MADFSWFQQHTRHTFNRMWFRHCHNVFEFKEPSVCVTYMTLRRNNAAVRPEPLLLVQHCFPTRTKNPLWWWQKLQTIGTASPAKKFALEKVPLHCRKKLGCYSFEKERKLKRPAPRPVWGTNYILLTYSCSSNGLRRCMLQFLFVLAMLVLSASSFREGSWYGTPPILLIYFMG